MNKIFGWKKKEIYQCISERQLYNQKEFEKKILLIQKEFLQEAEQMEIFITTADKDRVRNSKLGRWS